MIKYPLNKYDKILNSNKVESNWGVKIREYNKFK